MKLLLTGGCGFIGHHFVEHLLKNTDYEIILIDRLTYASSGFDRLRDIDAYDEKRVMKLTADFREPLSVGVEQEVGQVDYIVHMGAETHVNNSIKSAYPFVQSNVLGTMNMLEFARTQKNLRLFLYFSTDEVFGPAPGNTAYKEWDRYKSSNPYAATKAGGEELCIAYENTYKIPVAISHTMNVFGERQHPEKFIPLVVKAVLEDETIQIHSDSTMKIPGSRMWIHGRNVAAAIMFLFDNAQSGDKYNIVGEKEVNNLDMARFIANVVGKILKYEMVDFHTSRPGHDLRYALDGTKMYDMGWKLPINFEDSLIKTVEWTVANKDKWLYGIQGENQK